MSTTQDRRLTVSATGRSGTASYSDPDGELSCYWELGGNDVVTIVQAGSQDDWRSHYPWAYRQRSEILRFIAAEACRQMAPGARAEINERSGEILLRQDPATVRPVVAPQNAWYYRLRELKLKLAYAVLAVVLVFAALAGVKAMFFEIDPGSGTPWGSSVRTDTHIATLIQTLEAYTPSLHRDPGKDRYTLSVYVVPLAGGEAELVELASGLRTSEFALAKILGSDSQRLWVDVVGLKTVDLESHKVQDQSGPVPAALSGASTFPFTASPEEFLSAGFLSGDTEWTGLLSAAELSGEYALQKFVRAVESANTPSNSRESKRLYRAKVEPDSSGKYYRLLSMDASGNTEYVNAAFLRLDEKSEPMRLGNPESALVLFTLDGSLKGTTLMARVDLAGTELWRADSGIDRFKLSQLFPGGEITALVGTRPSEEGKVPEPLLVLVEHATGKTTTHSLWQ
jgi:hypothetical protein